MYCKKCGTYIEEGMKFCKKCGNPVSDWEDVKRSSENPSYHENIENNYQNQNPQPRSEQRQPEQPAQQMVQPQQIYNINSVITEDMIPAEYKPISMWGYLGYEILFSIPIIGFIVLIVFALGGTSNKNVKNFARSYFCFLIILVIAIIVFGTSFLAVFFS